MANKRITELPTMTSASMDGADLMLVVDRSFSETKSTSITELMGYLSSNLTVVNAEHSSNSENAETAEQADLATSASYATTSDTATSASYSEQAGTAFVGGNELSTFSVRAMSTLERNNISSPKLGSIIFNTTDTQFQGWTGTSWDPLN
jgi:hypothetical protein